jgi:hypothetical protein
MPAVPETSCEARNVYLDRTLLVETVAQTNVALFGESVQKHNRRVLIE